MFLVIAGTNRPGSHSLEVARVLESLFAELDQPARVIDLRELPAELFRPEAYAEKPAAFAELQEAVDSCRGILTVVPEYNGSYPGVLKYFVDMLRFPGSLAGVPSAFVGISAGMWGGLRAVEQMQMVFQYRFACLYSRRVFVPGIHKLLEGGKLTDDAMKTRLAELVSGFVAFSGKNPREVVTT